jgi:hypothetical protein
VVHWSEVHNQILFYVPLKIVDPFFSTERRDVMGELVHRSEILITRERGPTRKAIIKGFDQPVYYGVHGGIKGFYRIEPEEEHAATLDHVVGAVGG